MDAPAPAPAAQAAPEAPSAEMNTSAFEAALAAPPGKEAAAPAPEKAAEAPTPDKPAAEEKPAADEKPKKGLDALPDEEVEKKPDAEEKPAAEEEPEIDTKNWAKAQRDAFAAARVKAKLLAAERDDARNKVAEMEKKLSEQTPKDSEQTLKELEDLRTWKHAQNVKESPEWKSQVVEPIDKVFSVLDQIAEAAKVDPETLRAATDEEASFKRALAIKKVFDAAEEPVDQVLITAALSEADKLPPLYAKMDELQNKASEVWSSLQNQTTAQKEAAAKAAEGEYLKSHTHVAEQLKRKLPSIIDDAVAKDLAEARPSDDPADKAFATQAAILLPKVVASMTALKAEIAKLKASEAALLGSRGTVDKVAADPVRRENPDGDMDEDALAAALRAGK